MVRIAGDDPARRAVAPLVRDLGGKPLDAGGIDHAQYLEAMAAVIIRVLVRGADPLSAFQLTVGTASAT